MSDAAIVGAAEHQPNQKYQRPDLQPPTKPAAIAVGAAKMPIAAVATRCDGPRHRRADRGGSTKAWTQQSASAEAPPGLAARAGSAFKTDQAATSSPIATMIQPLHRQFHPGQL